MVEWLNKARTFINDTIVELKKCSWPTRDELYESTILVIVTVIMLALFVAGVDLVSNLVIEWITTI